MAIVKAKGLDNETADYSVLSKFSDADSISENLRKYVAIAVQNKIMNGNTNGSFNPLGNLTRAELTALISNVYDMGDKVVVGDEIEIKKYQVSVIADGAYIEGEGDYSAGEVVKITLTPKDGYKYLRVQRISNIGVDKIKTSHSGKDIVFTFNMPENNEEIEVLFTKEQCITGNSHQIKTKYTYIDNKEHTETLYCSKCDEILDHSYVVSHNFANGKCECGAEKEILYGNVDSDDALTLKDVDIIESMIGMVISDNDEAADVNLDKKITEMDLLLVKGAIQGVITLPHECTSYTERYKEIDSDYHQVSYYCDCGKFITIATEVHCFENGECYCGVSGETILYGDVNDDGKVNAKDLLRLSKYVDGQNEEIDEEASDVFKDGKIDYMDEVVLTKYFANWDIEYPHECEKYEIELAEKDDMNHVIKYECKCGQITQEVSEEHKLVNGKCECGYEKEIIYGDVNNDGKVNTKDILRLEKYLNGQIKEVDEEVADTYDDGRIDNRDVGVLLAYVSGNINEPYHKCRGYSVQYEKIDENNHNITYSCACDEINVTTSAAHEIENGKCKCGYKETLYNADYLEEAIDDVVNLEIIDLDKYDNEELDESVTKEEIIPIDLDGDSYNGNEKITQVEAVTMIVRALGWGEVVEQIGEWPSNYITKASELRLFKKMIDIGSEYETKGNVATLIHNALDAKRWDVIESPDGELTSDKNPATLREMYFDN